MADETQTDKGVQDDASSEDGAQDTIESQDFVSTAEFKSGMEMVISKIEAATQRNRQSQSDVIKHEVGEKLDSALKALGESFQPEASPAKPESDPESPSQDQDPSSSEATFGVQEEIEGILKKFGLKGDEPDLAAFVKDNEGKKWFEAGPGFYALAETLGAREAGAIQAGPGLGAAPRPDLVQEYVDGVLDLRKRLHAGELRTYEVQKLNTALKNKYRAQGVGVDTVVFSSDGTITEQEQPQDLYTT